MTKTKKKRCDVTNMDTNIDNFYMRQSHVKAVDNLRRGSGATKAQMSRMFNQLNTY